MIKFNIHNLIICIIFISLIVGCSKVRESAGVTRKSPDEYQAIENPPLVIPPDYNLLPPEQLKQKNIDNIEKDLAEQILFGLEEKNDSKESQLSTMNQILLKTNAMNTSQDIRDEINENFSNEMKLNNISEIEVLDAVEESENIEDNTYIIKEKKKTKKKKRFFFF